jgi:outer membrane protein assembly factor BamB
MRPAAALLLVLLLSPTLGAQRPATTAGAQRPASSPAAAPADAWRQFRGTPNLTGVSASAPPASLNVLWSYDTKDVIDSSAAIVDGVVYVGAGNGDLLALDLASGKLRWKYTTGNLIGESSPSVGDGAVYIGDLGGLLHAVNVKNGSRLWTFTTGSEIKSSP